ncbi:MAG TPA: hypothetical protein ENJ38_00670 [Rhodospirillales bacterium]|nr:hypothetical protein [Rhodospirillales bacterium]
MSTLDDPAGVGAEPSAASFCAFVRDEESRRAIEQVAGELPFGRTMVTTGGIRGAIEYLGAHRSPKVLMVDLSGSELPLTEIDELADVCEPGVTVVAFGDQNDVGLFRELVARGVGDYLVKPLSPGLVHEALLRALQGHANGRRMSRLGRLVGVLGARGGVGATMIACGIAHVIAETRRRRVCLTDLDLQSGTVALTFDLDPSHGLREALESPERIDSLFVDRAATKYSDLLHVLAAEESLDEECRPMPEALQPLYGELRTRFHFVVLDMPRPGSPLFLPTLEQLDELILVADPSLAAMRDGLRILQALARTSGSCHPTVVLNRVGAHRSGELEPKEFENGIGRKIDLRIPFDPKNVAAALNAGQLGFAERGPVGQAIRTLANIAARGPAGETRSIVRRLLAFWK